ncbi:MAG: MlaE family ABC transporter permease, partial [Chitinophagaceae bacterium]
PKNTLGYIVRDTIILEFSCTLICLILAGVIGSRIASEIGNMRIGEQIDAIELMGINSKGYLIMNRILASLLTIPCLVIIAMVIGIISARFFVSITLPTQIDAFDNGLMIKFQVFSVYYSLLKSFVYGFIISSVSSFFGFYVKGGSIEVGVAITKAVVVSCILILLADYCVSAMLL